MERSATLGLMHLSTLSFLSKIFYPCNLVKHWATEGSACETENRSPMLSKRCAPCLGVIFAVIWVATSPLALTPTHPSVPPTLTASRWTKNALKDNDPTESALRSSWPDVLADVPYAVATPIFATSLRSAPELPSSAHQHPQGLRLTYNHLPLRS